MTKYYFIYKVKQDIMRCTFPPLRQADNLFATILNAIIPLIKQVLDEMEITCFNGKEKDLCINKIGNIVRVDIVEDVKMLEVIFLS